MKPYGMELALDLRGADSTTFTRESLDRYFEELCQALGLERADLHFWDYDDEYEKYQAPPHLKGTSAVQFVTTSTVVVHTLDDLGAIFVNVFSCGEFDPGLAAKITVRHFGGEVYMQQATVRGEGLLP